VNNPDPIARAWRLEKRRKQLGSDHPRCFYCPKGLDADGIACLELDHPVTKGLDPEFTRIVCRNHHRRLEFQRDLAGLTQNGRRKVTESKDAKVSRYLLLLAEDHESIADAVLSGDGPPRETIAEVLRATAASLRRKATKLRSLR